MRQSAACNIAHPSFYSLLSSTSITSYGGDTIHRFFVASTDIQNNIVTLTGDNAAHGAVLRLRLGEAIVACCPSGVDHYSRVVSAGKNEIQAEITHSAPNAAEPPVFITLYQALPKGDKMGEIVEKCVELGVSAVVPVVTARCVARPADSGNKAARWRRIAESAAKQSGRGLIPSVSDPIALVDAFALAKAHDSAFVCLETEDKFSMKDFAKSLSASVRSIGLFVGPEGGFDDKEAALFATQAIRAVTLGRRILRTETAAAAAIAIILYELEGSLL